MKTSERKQYLDALVNTLNHFDNTSVDRYGLAAMATQHLGIAGKGYDKATKQMEKIIALEIKKGNLVAVSGGNAVRLTSINPTIADVTSNFSWAHDGGGSSYS